VAKGDDDDDDDVSIVDVDVVVTGHNRKVLSNVPANIYFPLGAYVTELTGGLFKAYNVFKHSPVMTSQNRINPSCDPETTMVPSRLNATAVTGSE
jgi:hypothetical protein